MKIGRQAVVVIHGIGEQRPMDTLRSFVHSVKEYLSELDESESKTTIRSKPDGISNIYETRRLSLSPTRNRPLTDFYEFYWAHNMRDSKFTDIYPWLSKLLFSKEKKIPTKLKKVWYTIWTLALLLTILAFALLLYFGVGQIKSFLSTLIILPTIFSLLFLLARNSFLSSVGDAGRYFTPTPSNVGERNNIRQQGITFLKKIHERTDDSQYDRVIIVGHSLGSVIAYDLLRLLWTEYNTHSTLTANIDQSAIEEIEKYASGKNVENINVFQNLQYKCWEQQRMIGQKWLITDFITIGSPLCNADYYIAQNVAFAELRDQLEFPVSPPECDSKSDEIHYMSKPITLGDKIRTIRILHHAALFAVCRWTNIYFTSDFIGGPMRRLFGDGIKDIAIKRKSVWFYPGGHTGYWSPENKTSLREIAIALQLRNG